jgi:hypothetical protein
MKIIYALLIIPISAVAQEQVALPQGCTGLVTVQMKSCTVSHHFICDADPDGYRRRVDMDELGLTYTGAVDAETQWMESFHFRSNHSERLEESPADPASFTALTETGADTYDFRTLSDEVGTTRYVGADTLTGETVIIDGEELLRTTYRIRAVNEAGEELWSSEGREFIHPEWRVFLAGEGTYRMPDGETFDVDDTPVDFVFPGETGFLSPNPIYGCNAVLSSFQSSSGR